MLLRLQLWLLRDGVLTTLKWGWTAVAVKIVWSEVVHGLWGNVESVIDSVYSQKQ